MNVYTHINFDNVDEEMKRIEVSHIEIEKKSDAKAVSQKNLKKCSNATQQRRFGHILGYFSVEK